MNSLLITLPHKNLRIRSKKVGIVSADIKKIINDMKKTTLDWEDNRQHEVGVALAAVQINKLLRIIIVREDIEDKQNRNFITLINPTITKYDDKIIEDYEGCLSIKDIYGLVPRYNKVRIKATDIDGSNLRINAEGFLARILQHEIDHTNGLLFIDHIKDKQNAFYKLNDKGNLESLSYEENIQNNSILW